MDNLIHLLMNSDLTHMRSPHSQFSDLELEDGMISISTEVKRMVHNQMVSSWVLTMLKPELKGGKGKYRLHSALKKNIVKQHNEHFPQGLIPIFTNGAPRFDFHLVSALHCFLALCPLTSLLSPFTPRKCFKLNELWCNK